MDMKQEQRQRNSIERTNKRTAVQRTIGTNQISVRWAWELNAVMHENMYNNNDGDGDSDNSRIDNNNQIQFEMSYGSASNTPKHTEKRRDASKERRKRNW